VHPFPVTPITTADDPRVRDFAGLKDAELRRQEFVGARSRFIAESELTVRRLLASRCGVRAVALAPEVLQGLAGAIAERYARGAFDVFVVEQSLMERVAGFNFHRGVLACGERPADADLAAILRDSTSLTILEGLSNHDNIGSVFRNVAALGGERPGVLLGPGCCDPFYRKALRVSIGHVLDVPFATLHGWPGALDRVKDAGWTVLALTPGGDMDVRALACGGRYALMLGAEGPGLTHGALAKADVRVRVPMRAGVDSLNVAVCGAVAMALLNP
jgi:tRNA G18 (ribose-2'-O)-methylase SpoU